MTAADDANKLLKKAVEWLDDANDRIDHWKKVREDANMARKEAKDASDPEERKIWEYRADADDHMADLGLPASREIQRAAAEALSGIQQEFYVKDVVVEEPTPPSITATASVELRPGATIPNGYLFWWKAGDVELDPNDTHWVKAADATTPPQWVTVAIDTSKLPFGDTNVEVLLGKVSKDPWKHI
jgi:hypothetical protein